jgi:hypothetical protein
MLLILIEIYRYELSIQFIYVNTHFIHDIYVRICQTVNINTADVDYIIKYVLNSVITHFFTYMYERSVYLNINIIQL